MKEIKQKLISSSQQNQKLFALLIDPDSLGNEMELVHTCNLAAQAGVDLFLVGGSLITNGLLDKCISLLKAHSEIPVVLFPGNILQINKEADAILFLSLISGRNPELLIGKHVIAAPMLKQSGIEVISTGYILIDGGRVTSVSYMSNTTPIPSDKPEIAACTALAGEMLGLNVMYMDAGSGAIHPIPQEVIKKVKSQISVPLFIGGGIRTPEQAMLTAKAGADIIVIGNAIEKDDTLIREMSNAIHSLNSQGSKH